MTPQQLLDDIASCLCEQIRSSPVPGVCFCGVIPGDGVVTEYVTGSDCPDGNQGMAWVRQGMIYPASGVNVVNETVRNCGSGIGMDIEVGMIRPAANPDDYGEPPTAEQYRASSALVNNDVMVMWRALACCDSLLDLDYILGTNQPFGPMGGVIGSVWSAAVLLD